MPFNPATVASMAISAGGSNAFQQSGTSYTVPGGATATLPGALLPMPNDVGTAKIRALEAGGNPGHPGVLSTYSSAMLQALVQDHKGTYSNDPAAITFLKTIGMK